MVTILVGLLGVFMPIGAGFWIVAFQVLQGENTKLSWIFMLLGSMFWVIGIYIWKELIKAYKQEERDKQEEYLQRLKTELQVIGVVGNQIISELQGLRQDLTIKKEDKNE